MRIVRSFLLVAACMAAAGAYAQSAGQWRFSMDDARRITGMIWSSNAYSMMAPVLAYDQLTSGNRVEVRRINGPVGTLPQQLVGRQSAFTVAPSGAIIEIPTRVRIPGRTLEVPATIIEPVPKQRLASIAGKALKIMPVVGTALQIAELIDEIDVTRKSDGEFYAEAPAGSVISSGYVAWVTADGSIKAYNPESFCQLTTSSPIISEVYSIQQIRPDTQEWKCLARWPNGFTSIYGSLAGRSSCPQGNLVVNGQCQQQSNQPFTEQQLIDRINQLASLERLVSALNSLPYDDPNIIDVFSREIKDDPEDQYVRLINIGSNPSQPETIQVGDPITTTITNPDGSTETTTKATTATALGNQITFETKTQTVRRDAAGNTTSITTTTTTPTSSSNPNSDHQEITTCGLPSSPPCKIDEAGTPQAPEDDGNDIFRSLLPECLRGDWKSCIPELPDINWAFSLPSGCGPIPVPFGNYGFSEINICRWQPMIHDLMSMLWAGAGLFAAIGILSGRRITED